MSSTFNTLIAAASAAASAVVKTVVSRSRSSSPAPSTSTTPTATVAAIESTSSASITDVSASLVVTKPIVSLRRSSSRLASLPVTTVARTTSTALMTPSTPATKRSLDSDADEAEAEVKPKRVKHSTFASTPTPSRRSTRTVSVATSSSTPATARATRNAPYIVSAKSKATTATTTTSARAVVSGSSTVTKKSDEKRAGPLHRQPALLTTTGGTRIVRKDGVTEETFTGTTMVGGEVAAAQTTTLFIDGRAAGWSTRIYSSQEDADQMTNTPCDVLEATSPSLAGPNRGKRTSRYSPTVRKSSLTPSSSSSSLPDIWSQDFLRVGTYNISASSPASSSSSRTSTSSTKKKILTSAPRQRRTPSPSPSSSSTSIRRSPATAGIQPSSPWNLTKSGPDGRATPADMANLFSRVVGGHKANAAASSADSVWKGEIGAYEEVGTSIGGVMSNFRVLKESKGKGKVVRK